MAFVGCNPAVVILVDPRPLFSSSQTADVAIETAQAGVSRIEDDILKREPPLAKIAKPQKGEPLDC
ncbi:hypothetical protein [Methylopila turkensis]|uniref:Uncharacterized protein n=1 Tax=Methylopila turkensis TaxID=1437816 RepID=A0A9W6JMZ8_9HYPH|nr:hypothetical protein [Methylopila turkensis]GLK80077.1 hypothetical protein GCM10008174_18180 [Methylopila turkensis]